MASSGQSRPFSVGWPDVRFSPDSGGIADILQPPLRAKNGLMQCSKWALQRSLLVQPHVLVTIAIIGAVHHDGDALDIGLPARAPAAVEDDRTSDVLLQLLVDLPDQLLALLDIRFLRLLVEQLFDVLVAVVRVVPLRAAGIVLVEGLVGIVDRVASQVKAKGIILARELRGPLRC